MLEAEAKSLGLIADGDPRCSSVDDFIAHLEAEESGD